MTMGAILCVCHSLVTALSSCALEHDVLLPYVIGSK